MTRDELRGKVQTVTGLIEPAELGPTLLHEHLLCDLTPPRLVAINEPAPVITLENYHDIMYGRVTHSTKYRLKFPAIITEEIARLRDAGGRSVVDLTCGGLQPDPNGLAAISQETGINIVMGCGYYVEEYQAPENHAKTVDQFAQEMIGQVFHGAWGTDVRAGIIGEIGCQNPWTDQEKRVLRGAIEAQHATGATLNVHPGRNKDLPIEIATFVKTAGGDLTRLVISHIDRTIFDEDRLLALADTGCVIEFDLFGWEVTYYEYGNIDMPNDGTRLRLLRVLIDHGHLDQIAISHDICHCPRLTKFGGHGYAHIFKNVVPLMRERGFSEQEIDTILVHTPARLLTIQ
jgi:phosphotriesterase-related protein